MKKISCPLEKGKKIYLGGNLLTDKEALMGNWLAHGNANDVIGIREGFETYLPHRSKIVDSPDQADIIVLCLGEKEKDEW